MIYLEKGQKVKDRPDLVVYEQTGERNDSDMVICAKVETPDEPFCWLEAQYIEYGGLVYTINDEKELEKEILKFDPNTTINDAVGTPVQQEVVAQPTPEVPQQQTPAQAPVQNEVIQTPTPTAPTEQPLVPSEPVAPATPVENNTNASSTPPVEPVVVPPAGDPVSSQVVEPVVDPIPQTPAAEPTPAPIETPAPAEPVVSINNRRIRKIIV